MIGNSTAQAITHSQYFVLVQFMCVLFYLLHAVACAYCLLSRFEAALELASWEDNSSLDIVGTQSRYLHALEFAIFAMVLTYSRAMPATVAEQIFAVLTLMAMGAVYACESPNLHISFCWHLLLNVARSRTRMQMLSVRFAVSSQPWYVLGAVRPYRHDVFRCQDPAGTEYRNTRDLMKSFGREMDMPADLRHELLEYLENCRSLLRQRYYQDLLHLLSPTLRGRVVKHTHGKFLKKVAIPPPQKTRSAIRVSPAFHRSHFSTAGTSSRRRSS